jgi:dextranase
MYAPGAEVAVTLVNAPEESASLRVTLLHLETEVLRLDLPAAEAFSFALPEEDFTGYLLRVEALSEGGEALETAYTGIDCSSTWTKFPRYGYVWDYTVVAQPEEKIALMTRYHINGIQFYDWQYRHHQPVAEDTTSWKDWSGRTIYGDVIRAYIGAAHARGMVAMAYNLIYGANQTYLTDGSGVEAAWRLRKGSGTGDDFTFDMNALLGDVGVLQLFNPLDPGWQSYIFAQEQKVFDTFDFDGWHGDTVGDHGRMATADGQPLGMDAEGNPIYLVKETYTQFLNAAKAAIGDRYLAFNPVGAQGIEGVNISDVDVLYTEFWPWDDGADGLPYASYYSLHQAIHQASEQSGGKSLIVAAYVNYKNPKSSFNEPAVRMMDSVVFASGGARIELGNGDNMLSDEYFPSD